MNSALSGIIGFILIIGTVISYGVQFHKIIINKSITGINIYTISMGCLSSCCTMYASILLNLSTLKSFEIGLDVSQLIIVCICYYTYIVIYMYYIKNDNNITFYNQLYEVEDLDRNYRHVFILFCLSWIILIILGTASIIAPTSQKLIDTMYIIATITSIIQWIPQVIETYMSTMVSSLSFITLALNTCGCLLTIIYQFLINGQSFLLVLPYLVCALLQIVILIILMTTTRRNDSPLLRYDEFIEDEVQRL